MRARWPHDAHGSELPSWPRRAAPWRPPAFILHSIISGHSIILWSLLAKSYPDLALTQAWRQATVFLSQYGTVAIFAVMALPLPVPKLPLLAVAGIYRLPVLDVPLANFSGKLIKYILYAYLAPRFPGALLTLGASRSPIRLPTGSGVRSQRSARTFEVSSKADLLATAT